MADEKNIHHGHRKRMKEAMLSHGIEGLNDHQVMELLLFYGISNGDTNPIAHRLVERFGSLKGALEADYKELLQVKGVGENSASLIKFVQQLSRRYLQDAYSGENEVCFPDTDSLRRYYEAVFLGVRAEQVRAMLVDDELYMIKEQIILEGTVSKVELSTRKIADFVVKNNCNRLILAHNHPNGVALPSKEDILVTKELNNVLNMLDISLLDHIIVGRTGSLSMRSVNMGYGIWKTTN